ncbi:MAG TPA: glycerol kinase GlpK [Candidatus Obscuribacterales bacterium]
MTRYILSIDSGTTSCRAILFDTKGGTMAVGQREFKQHFPKAGWVEHDAMEILETQIGCIEDCITKAAINPLEIACIGVTNQRETTVVWDKKTGKPIHNAIVWQCRRTQDVALALRKKNIFRDRTGLLPDAYFSGPKIQWLLDNVAGARARAENGELLFGTIDTWLIWNLTGRKVHATEPSNASRTMAFNLKTLDWDPELLQLLNVPRSMFPQVLPSNGNFGKTDKDVLGFEAPITAVLGDQQAALFGQACFQDGMGKTTYGTGAFLLVNIGRTPAMVPGLLTTVAWQLEGHPATYGLEGAIFIAGAAVQWLRDGLGIIESSDETESWATSIESNDGVYFVPALVGLGSPWWDSDVRGAIVGITRGTTRAHFARAALESMAYQVADVADAMRRHNISMVEQRVDGGATKNNFLMQFQADVLGVPVVRSAQAESTAWGVAALAGMKAGIIKGLDEVTKNWKHGDTFTPKTNRAHEHNGWKAALRGAFAASKPEDARITASVH